MLEDEYVMTVRQLIKLLEDDGWYQVRMRGSHRMFKHPTKKRTVVVPGKKGSDVPKGTLNSVLKQADIEQ